MYNVMLVCSHVEVGGSCCSFFSQVFLDSTPFHDGYGMLTVGGIPKPVFRAFQLMHRLGNYSMDIQWETVNNSEVVAFVFTQKSNSTIQVMYYLAL